MIFGATFAIFFQFTGYEVLEEIGIATEVSVLSNLHTNHHQAVQDMYIADIAYKFAYHLAVARVHRLMWMWAGYPAQVVLFLSGTDSEKHLGELRENYLAYLQSQTWRGSLWKKP